jgi:serine/threonine protein kinase
MPDERWQRIEELFEAGLSLAAEDRAAFLAERCSDDASLRAEVAALLAHDAVVPHEFLAPQTRPQLSPDCSAADSRVGSSIGPYVLQAVIASGGMGTVYLAEQQNPRRPVALKVLRGGLTGRNATRRFEYEAQVLGRLQHRAIAQIFEAGVHLEETPSGPLAVPYFAMEYVDGARTLLAYAAQSGLDLRARLRLFAEVCDAVHHGHQKGVIHRDLKPANILVDSSGAVKVIDFGVARAVDSDVALTTLRTSMGELIGTLQYMSPEQCDGDARAIDTRSDVYSLGVILYELLTGRLPYDAGRTTVYAAIRTIREAFPPSPASLDRKLKGDPDLIVLKALQKDKEMRYGSAAALADDIRRHLAHEPISARPPTVWSRIVRWPLRHPVLATLGTCTAIAASALTFTWAAVGWLNQRPHHIEQDEYRAVQLLARTGKVLHEWPQDAPVGDRRVGAGLLARPSDAPDDKWLAFVGFYSNGDVPGRVCAYDIAMDFDKVVWSAEIEPADLPDDLRATPRPNRTCNPQLLAVADIFPTRPGKEILATFVYLGFSQRAICIYGFDGKLLFRIWQDGGVSAVRWLDDAALLICVGADEDVKAKSIESGLGPHCVYQTAIWSLRPELGMIARDYMQTPLRAGIPVAVWYRYLGPPQQPTADQGLEFSTHLYPRRQNHEPASAIEVCVDNFRWKGVRTTGGFGFLVDAHGNEIEGSRVLSDDYRSALKAGLVPPDTEFVLHDEPPDFTAKPPP